MDARKRLVCSLSFDPEASPLFWHMFGLMPGVLQRWHLEGLPPRIDEKQIPWHFGFDAYGWLREMRAKDGNFYPIVLPFPYGFDPPFQTQVIEDTKRHIIYTNGLGCKLKLIKGYSTVPKIIENPIKHPSDWPPLRSRLQFHEHRLREDWLKQHNKIRAKGLPVVVKLSGLFSFPRNLMGERLLCLAYYRNPDLVQDILETYCNLIVNVAGRMLSYVEADALSFAEDMAYRHGPMISPRLFKDFMLPYYNRVIYIFREKGTRIFCVDSDGNLDLLIPLFIEAGINVIGPMEVQAGMDIVKLRKRYGNKMAYFGGLDKIAITKSFEDIDRELEAKLPMMLETGGYSIGLDHRVLKGTPLKNFEYYVGRVSQILWNFQKK